MSEFVYLMKNDDLYKIGCTGDLKNEAIKMKPGQIISSFKVKDSKFFEVRLLRLYKRKRIPDTNYFRLSEAEVDDCKKHLEGRTNLPKGLSDELRIGLNGSLLFSIITLLISFFISKMFIFSLFLSILVASLPMWSLVILGSFGGYDVDDLNPFTTFSIRLRGLLIAISMISVAYVIYTFSRISIGFLS
tara:strand:+ start:90 stop:656 length:567 start_codon:yes stop_codon:yes gene_type:complete